MNGYQVVTPPANEPVTLAEVKAHLRITDSDSDDYITNFLIPAAREHTETYTQRALINRTLDVFYDRFRRMELPFPPLVSVESVKYVDATAVEQTLLTSVYDVDTVAEPGAVCLASGQSWPIINYQPNPITIRITAGYGANASDVPTIIRSAILLLIGHLYENRESSTPLQIHSLPMGYESVLNPYRIWGFS